MLYSPGLPVYLRLRALQLRNQALRTQYPMTFSEAQFEKVASALPKNSPFTRSETSCDSSSSILRYYFKFSCTDSAALTA